MSRLLTLNIGASKAVVAEYALDGKGALTLTAYGSGELPAVDVNDPGSIAATLPSVIHQVMREQGIRPAPVVVSLSGQMVFARAAKLPPVADKDKLDQQVQFEIEQNVPFPIDEIVSDYQVVGTAPDGDIAAMTVAAKLESVRAVTDSVRSAGLKPITVDVSPIAVCNVLKYVNPSLDGCNVILDIGSKTTNLIIVENEKIYNRSIPVAGNNITKELAQNFGCSFEEAEQLKLERGYVALGGVNEDPDEITDRVSKVIRSVFTRLHAEISRSINFYRSQQGGSAPARLYLTGGTARLPQLAEFFMDSLQVEVDFLNPFVSVGFGPKVDETALESDAFALTESVGLALRGTDLPWIAINLLPPELVQEARAIRRIPFVAAGAAAFLVALGIGWFVESRAGDAAQAKIECVEGRNASLKKFETMLKTEQKNVQEQCERCDAFQKTLRARSAELRRMQDVRKALVGGMWITEWSTVQPSRDKQGARPLLRVTMRGWSDAMKKVQDDWARRNEGKQSTVAEIVASALKRSSEFVPDTVKIASQKDIKDVLQEFSVQMELAPDPTVIADSKERKGKAAR